MKRRYSISLSEYYHMLWAQNGVCAICHETPEYKLAVDHDHETGAIRGLLCHGCNKALGLLKDESRVVENALAYLLRTIETTGGTPENTHH